MHTVTQSSEILKAKVTDMPAVGIILGSGWNHFVKDLQVETEVPYKEFLGVEASVPGHEGKLVIGTHQGQRVVCMVGRLHTYEGYTSEEATRPVQALAEAGVTRIIITAAVGALNESYRVGDFVIVSDLLTAYCPSPLHGPDFVDMSAPVVKEWGDQVLAFCQKSSFRAHQGVYCFVRGPHFETFSDKRKYRADGADVIGMSMVPETIMANKLKVKVLGLAFVTNLAFVKHDHHDVLAAANEGKTQMVEVLKTSLLAYNS